MLGFCCFAFFFNDTATTEIYTLSLHDALPICGAEIAARDAPAGQQRLDGAVDGGGRNGQRAAPGAEDAHADQPALGVERSEEHTSELQSRQYLVCRLLLEKKKDKQKIIVY